MVQMDLTSYQFSVEVNCTAELSRWSHQTELWFILFYIICDILQSIVCIMALLFNAISFVALGMDDSDSALALQLRTLCLSDTIFVLANTLDNFCHTIESIPNADLNFYFLPIYVHPIAWSFRAPFITIHNWTMLFVSVVRYVKIRWPLKGSLWFTQSRTMYYIVAIWVISLGTSLIRCLEVTTIYGLCPDGLYRLAIVATKIFPTYTTVTNFGLQTVTPVLIAVAANALLLYTIKHNAKFQKENSSGGASRADSQLKDMTRMIVLLLQLYLICQIPMILFGFNVLLTIPTPVYIVIGLVGNVISSLDGSCNFIIYVYANPRFKKNVKQIFGIRDYGAGGEASKATSTMSLAVKP